MSHTELDEACIQEVDASMTAHRVTVEVSDDHLRAWVSPTNPDDPLSITIEATVDALKTAKIDVDEKVLDQVKNFVDRANSNNDHPLRHLAAEGFPAVEGKDGTYQRHESCLRREQDWQGDAAINYYTYNSIHMVEKDDPIGTLVPAVAGVNGIDVYGKILLPVGHPKDVKLETSVRRSEDDPAIVFANAPGQIDFSKSVLSIKDVINVGNDVNFETGNINAPVDVQISGTVHDGFIVKSRRTITIGGAIETATIEAQNDVIVRGGILQKGRSSVTSGGDIVARFCDEADLRAAGDVKICKELMSSHVHCDGKLFAAGGAVVGGYVYAREGVEVASIGSDANVKTEIAVGIHPDVIEEIERIRDSLKSKKETAERIRISVKPLLADMKRLSAEQKEKATELMFEADAMDADVAVAESKCSTMFQNARAHGIPFVLASKAIHEGVSIRIGRRITSFHKAMDGPVKIEKRKIKNVTEFVAIKQLNGSVNVLPSNYVAAKPCEKAVGLASQSSERCDGSGC